ncbi:MAG: MATE family efflux transporter, partial [Chloroflexota bacterium]|nr:MATE family efflux transporter [Chloroflexota bacterium]
MRPDEPTLVSTPIASLTTDVTATAVETVPSSAGPALLRSAGIVAAAFVASRLLGLVREVIVASRFGTEGDASAYVAAFRIPDLLFLIIMAGSFGSAFVPVFAGFLGRGDEERAWRLASAVLTWSVLSVAVMAVLAFVFAGPLTTLMVGGLDPEYQQKTVNLMRLLLLSPIFLGLGIAAKGILEAQDLYLFPALSPLVY